MLQSSNVLPLPWCFLQLPRLTTWPMATLFLISAKRYLCSDDLSTQRDLRLVARSFYLLFPHALTRPGQRSVSWSFFPWSLSSLKSSKTLFPAWRRGWGWSILFSLARDINKYIEVSYGMSGKPLPWLLHSLVFCPDGGNCENAKWMVSMFQPPMKKMISSHL